MSGERIVVLGTPKTLEANGALIANNALVQADDASYDIVADGPSGAAFPDAEFVLTCTFGTAPTEGTSIALYARPLDIDGTSDAEPPEATRPNSPARATRRSRCRGGSSRPCRRPNPAASPASGA